MTDSRLRPVTGRRISTVSLSMLVEEPNPFKKKGPGRS